jgi:diadenosine tetraphosphate (Ap4A) HIT family hydrolase
MNPPVCELCAAPGGDLLWADERCRVVLVADAQGAAFPGYCRVVWQAHVAEMSDLPPADAAHLMRVTFAVERMLRRQLSPDKINLASLGNLTPHLHWHVIPRWRDDSHFPSPIWAAPCRTGVPRAMPDRVRLATTLQAELAARMSEDSS